MNIDLSCDILASLRGPRGCVSMEDELTAGRWRVGGGRATGKLSDLLLQYVCSSPRECLEGVPTPHSPRPRSIYSPATSTLSSSTSSRASTRSLPPPPSARSSSLGIRWRSKLFIKPMAPVDEHDVLLRGTTTYNTANNRSICSHDLLNNNHITAKESIMRGRAASELPAKNNMLTPTASQPRANSAGPACNGRRKPCYDQAGIYECNYESIDGYSSGKSDDCPTSAILQLENAVKCLDQVLEKDIKRMKYESSNKNDDYNPKKVQYDSITVMPLNPGRELPPTPTRELPPTPLPRTRSFRQQALQEFMKVEEFNKK